MTDDRIREQCERDIATRLFSTGCMILGDPARVRDAFEKAAREHFGFVAQAGSMDRFIVDVRRAMMDFAAAATPDPHEDYWERVLDAAYRHRCAIAVSEQNAATIDGGTDG